MMKIKLNTDLTTVSLLFLASFFFSTVKLYSQRKLPVFPEKAGSLRLSQDQIHEDSIAFQVGAYYVRSEAGTFRKESPVAILQVFQLNYADSTLLPVGLTSYSARSVSNLPAMVNTVLTTQPVFKFIPKSHRFEYVVIPALLPGHYDDWLPVNESLDLLRTPKSPLYDLIRFYIDDDRYHLAPIVYCKPFG